METLAPVWTHNPGDLCDLGERVSWGENKKQTSVSQRSTGWRLRVRTQSGSEVDWGDRVPGPQTVSFSWVPSESPPAGLTWAEQLSPHLQRNQQLQDALLQRDEQLLRLQEENNKLRRFLSGSYVRNLQHRVQKLPADGRRQLKRNLHVLSSHPVSKRVCRNLTAEFCSQTAETTETTETSSQSEPHLDLWVLQTLGLKDRDTIDTSAGSSPSEPSVYDTSTSSTESPLDPAGPAGPAGPDPALVPGPTRLYDPPAFRPVSGVQHFTQAPSRPPGAAEATSPVSSLGPDPGFFWSLPAEEDFPFTPILTSSPASSPPAPPARSDLAFSMSLSPSSSVRTHSFPQGQAFVRKDPEGRWNFTWVPRQEG
ncbi:uncharacterized protein V6R79_018919 [Siganus canaliculatus]